MARRTWVSVGSPPAMLALETALLRTRKRPVVSSSLVSRAMLTGPVNTYDCWAACSRSISVSSRGSCGPRPWKRSWSASESSTTKLLGTRRRSRLRIWAELSTSRLSAAAISTGCTALRKVRAKTPEIICSSLFSKR